MLRHGMDIARAIRRRLAVGWAGRDAFGQVALGQVALGQVALGQVALGQVALGKAALHQLKRAGHGLLGAFIAALLRPLQAIAAIPGHPLLRLFVGEVHAVTFRVFAYGCALSAMGLMAWEFASPLGGATVAQAPPAPEWVDVARPYPAFAMTMPELDDARYAIWRHPDGGGRKDVFTFGSPAEGGATAVVEVYRPGAEPDPESDVVTASIPELRLSGRPIVPTTIATKFGEMAVDPFTDQAPGGERSCLRFWRTFDEPRLEIAGWYCNAGAEIVDRGMIACALDRLTLVTAASEPKTAALFAQAEVRRNFCGTNSVFLAATPKRMDWIAAARDPKLRGRK